MNSRDNQRDGRRKRGPRPSGMTPLTIKVMAKHCRWLDFLVTKATYGHSRERIVESLLHRVFRDMLDSKELPEDVLSAEMISLPKIHNPNPASETDNELSTTG